MVRAAAVHLLHDCRKRASVRIDASRPGASNSRKLQTRWRLNRSPRALVGALATVTMRVQTLLRGAQRLPAQGVAHLRKRVGREGLEE